MKLRTALLACAGLCVVSPAFAQDAGLAADAKAFGSREAVIAPSLSPDGTSILYVTPGPRTFAVISNLATGQSMVITSADGTPDVLRWCDYAALDRVVCQVTANVDRPVAIVGIQRLLSMDADGKNPKLLGQPNSFYDESIRQFDDSTARTDLLTHIGALLDRTIGH